MGRKREDEFSPDAFRRNIYELCELTDAFRAIPNSKGEDGREIAMRALGGIIADRIDALADAVHEARE